MEKIQTAHVLSVDPKGPCAGLLNKGDVISCIEDSPVKGLGIKKFIELASGDEGTLIFLKYIRGTYDVLILNQTVLFVVAHSKMQGGQARKNFLLKSSVYFKKVRFVFHN